MRCSSSFFWRAAYREYLSRSVEISGCPAYNKTRQNVASDTLDTCHHHRPTQPLVPQRSVYVRHSSIRRDILSDTKNLARLVPRIRDEGFRKNDINIPSDVERRKRERGERERCRRTRQWYRRPARNCRLLNIAQLSRNRWIPRVSPESIELSAWWNDDGLGN